MTSTASAYPPIHDYALIGDCRTAALVSSSGSIDWLCLPRFDSSSCFNRLLDWNRGGYCVIQPTAHFRTSRRYHTDSAVLDTDFATEEGRARLTDLMPVAADGGPSAALYPLRQVLRRVQGLHGRIHLSLRVRPRFDDGQTLPVFTRRGPSLYCADLGGRLVSVACDAPLHIETGELTATFSLSEGESVTLWLAYAEEAPAVYPCLSGARAAIEETLTYWRSWTGRCRATGPYRDAILRSAITLKLLTYAPSGAIVAAPTTSLPERFGGDLNWDYRYCWLRDASFTAQAFVRLGLQAESAAFVQWMTHATTLTYPALQVMYTLHGESSIPERSWTFFEGYRRSHPVRLGNAAADQYQLDVYGEVLDSLLLSVESGFPVDRETKRWIVRVGNLICNAWPNPDHGIWEVRGHRRHYVHSKVMCWVALDRAEQLARGLGVAAETAAWSQAREAIVRTIHKTGYSQSRRSFVQVLGGSRLDAAALTFGLNGFIGGRDPRMASTIAAIQRWLARGPLVYRYLAERKTGREEGTFLPCSFWLVEALAHADRAVEAEDLLALLQARANDVGLFPEEIRYHDGAFLGNFPLALTHVAHLGALLRLTKQS